MKKIFFIFFAFFLALSSIQAQFSTDGGTPVVTATKLSVTLNKLDEAFFFNGIKASTSITFSYTTPTTFTWYKYGTNPTSKVQIQQDSNTSSSTLYSVEDGFGYVLEYADTAKYFWVFDLKNIGAFVYSIVADNDGVNPCSSTHLKVNVKSEPLEYYSSLGKLFPIPRIFTISYNTLEWNSSSYQTKQVELSESSLVTGYNDITVDAPLTTTKFTISGDQFNKALNITSFATQPTPDYTPVAVSAHLTAVIAERDAKNEVDRTKGSLGGSAPLVVDFTSNANTPIALYYEWYIIKSTDTTDIVYYTDKDLRYSFKNAGIYTVKLKVSDAQCLVTDTITATISESSLEVPNVFTPNGDGKDDEFRVAYKSLTKFHAWVFNRWGRKVFEWSDPGKGWDGRIGGKMAQPGAYYYIIEAEGADIDASTKKAKKFVKKGDINLIRGK